MSEALFESHAGRRRVIKDPQRSRISNGTSFLPGVDGRGPYVRRAKDLIHDHLQDLGGPDNASVAERSIVRRCAVIETELEHLEARFVLAGSADPGDLGTYLAASNCLRRLLETIGLKRRARDVTPPSVAAYIEHIEAGKAHQRPSYAAGEASQEGP